MENETINLIVSTICKHCVHKALRTLQQFVELFGAGGDLDDLRSPLVELGSRGETHRHKFGSFRLGGEGK